MEELLTVREVGKILKVDRRTVINLINAKKLKGAMIGSQYRVRKEDLAEYIKNMEV